jgi:hypothetical protein
MSVVSSGVVVTIAVDDMGMEAVLIGNILHGPDVATWFL